jgi:serralysin
MASATDDTDRDATAQVFSRAKGGLYGGPVDTSDLDPNVVAQLMGYRWATSFGGTQPATTITYAFPSSTAAYTSDLTYPSTNELATFQPLNEFQEAAVRTGLALVASYTNLKFQEVAPGTASQAAFRFAQYTPDPATSEARFPANEGAFKAYQSDSRDTGDMFLGQNSRPTSFAFFGTDHFTTIIHEMGHSFGLKHGHDGTFHGTLAPQVNDNEFSVMTYASYFGANTATGASEARLGSSPTSYMMYDIAALQVMYGANFGKVGAKETYRWDKDTGQQFIGTGAAPNTGVTATDKIFTTVWTQGATVTYDLREFTQDQVDDLRPGHFLKFSNDQLADLNNAVDAGTAGFIAQGNVYNALLYHGDLRSAVANLITGIGNDTLIGNDRDNVLTAGDGIDIISTAGGNDTVSGGAGTDTIFFGSGYSVLRDTLADLNGDVVRDFGFGTVDVLGQRFAWSNVDLNLAGTKATITVDGSIIELNGSFFSGNGAFVVSQRGVGADEHTAVSYVNVLPNLAEGRSVNPILINGVADKPFMTGDGAVSFTLELKSAVSAFANTLGVYKIGADGTISDVQVLFANTLNVAQGAKTVDLGVLGNGQHFGFFLVQDGADLFKAPTGTLSFVTPGTNAAANVDIWLPPTLVSSTQGTLSGHQIFHSSANLNPNASIQVLSGVQSGGQQLHIGFEDLPMATGDRDYQDVVVGIHATGDGFFFT